MMILLTIRRCSGRRKLRQAVMDSSYTLDRWSRRWRSLSDKSCPSEDVGAEGVAWAPEVVLHAVVLHRVALVAEEALVLEAARPHGSLASVRPRGPSVSWRSRSASRCRSSVRALHRHNLSTLRHPVPFRSRNSVLEGNERGTAPIFKEFLALSILPGCFVQTHSARDAFILSRTR